MTYTQLALILVAVSGCLAVLGCAATPRERRGRHTIAVITTAAILCLLTVVFDSLMIHAQLFVFDADKLSGITLWLAPIEDLSYALACALALPAVWALARRGRE